MTLCLFVILLTAGLLTYAAGQTPANRGLMWEYGRFATCKNTHTKNQIDTTPLWILKQGWGHMLESYRLLYQEFSTPPSFRYTAYICSVSSWLSGGCQAVPQLYNVSGEVRNLSLGKETGANIGTDMNFYHSSISSSQHPPFKSSTRTALIQQQVVNKPHKKSQLYRQRADSQSPPLFLLRCLCLCDVLYLREGPES